MDVPDLNIPAVRRSPLSWKKLLKQEKFLQLPAAHDALAAKLIQRAGLRLIRSAVLPLMEHATVFPTLTLLGSMKKAPPFERSLMLLSCRRWLMPTTDTA